jgi:hypothetical protein
VEVRVGLVYTAVKDGYLDALRDTALPPPQRRGMEIL